MWGTSIHGAGWCPRHMEGTDNSRTALGGLTLMELHVAPILFPE